MMVTILLALFKFQEVQEVGPDGLDEVMKVVVYSVIIE